MSSYAAATPVPNPSVRFGGATIMSGVVAEWQRGSGFQGEIFESMLTSHMLRDREALLQDFLANALGQQRVTMPGDSDADRTVFVAYPYALPEDDYRGVFADVAEEFNNVSFIYADEEITNKHILEKIETMMERAAFSLFDTSLWNANVALELGIAYGKRLDYYILFNPTHGETDVLADLRGIDRIEYRSYGELRTHLSKLMRDQFGAPEREVQPGAEGIEAQLEAMREEVRRLLREEPGQPIGSIASSLGESVSIAQMVVRPMVGHDVETRGVRRGTRYYLMGEAPPEDDEEAAEAHGRGDESPAGPPE
jgi:hypothetical protein